MEKKRGKETHTKKIIRANKRRAPDRRDCSGSQRRRVEELSQHRQPGGTAFLGMELHAHHRATPHRCCELLRAVMRERKDVARLRWVTLKGMDEVGPTLRRCLCK